jgi:hypothetical protein
VTEVPSPQLRISDQNRESALSALGEHMTAGRIDIDEYGERSARITAAKTRGELSEIFADLPAPHPRYEDVPSAVAAPEPDPGSAPVPQRSGSPAQWSPAQRFITAFVPLIWIATIALIATGVVHGTLILLPIGLSVFGRAMWGHGHRDDHHRDRHDRHDRHLRDRERRRALRESYRREPGR